MTTFYLRNPGLVAYSVDDHLHLLRPGHPETIIGPTDPVAITDALAHLVEPVDEADVHALLDEATAAMFVERDILLTGSLDELTELSSNAGDDAPRCDHLVLGISGSIAAVHAPTFTLPLLRGFASHVDVIVTDAAAKLVRPDAFAFLGAEVWTDDFAPRGEINVPHIHLARTADLLVVWPTSAATIAKLANGACNDLLSLTITASGAPTVLFPTMNHGMWTSPAVARNVAQLREDGYIVVEPGPGVANADKGRGPVDIGAVGTGAFALDEILTSVLVTVRGAQGDGG